MARSTDSAQFLSSTASNAGSAEDFAGNPEGLDNDGDGFYDQFDVDCPGLFTDGFESGSVGAWSGSVGSTDSCQASAIGS